MRNYLTVYDQDARVPGMNRKTLISAAVVGFLLALVLTGAVLADNSNSASYWEGQTEHPSTCYKHDSPTSSNEHGSSNGSSVTLNPFNPNWPGDHWEMLVVKGGSEQNGGGDAVYSHPSAGIQYTAPINPQTGYPFGVSHWIVCKGTTPTTTTTTTTSTTEVPPSSTTTTTVAPTTTSTSTTSSVAPTTTVPETTTTGSPTTSLPPTTSTSVPGSSSTSSTVPQPTTSTSLTPTTVLPTTSVALTTPPIPSTTTTSSVSRRLPTTGQSTLITTLLATAFLGLGAGALAVSRRRPS